MKIVALLLLSPRAKCWLWVHVQSRKRILCWKRRKAAMTSVVSTLLFCYAETFHGSCQNSERRWKFHSPSKVIELIKALFFGNKMRIRWKRLRKFLRVEFCARERKFFGAKAKAELIGSRIFGILIQLNCFPPLLCRCSLTWMEEFTTCGWTGEYVEK